MGSSFSNNSLTSSFSSSIFLLPDLTTKLLTIRAQRASIFSRILSITLCPPLLPIVANKQYLSLEVALVNESDDSRSRFTSPSRASNVYQSIIH
jgi:hypothetical protein